MHIPVDYRRLCYHEQKKCLEHRLLLHTSFACCRIGQHLNGAVEDHRRTHGEPPAAMMAVYEYIHQKHIDALADARRYQDVYKSS